MLDEAVLLAVVHGTKTTSIDPMVEYWHLLLQRL
jgi:hypothetical protein